MDWEWVNNEKMRKCRKWISLDFLILSPFPHSLSISSSFSHSPSIFLQPGCQDATICATLISFNIIQCSIITVNCGDQEILPKYDLHTIKHTSLTSLSFKSCRLLYLCYCLTKIFYKRTDRNIYDRCRGPGHQSCHQQLVYKYTRRAEKSCNHMSY